MDRWTWMMARMYAPSLGALVIGLLLMLPLGMIRESPLLAGIYAVVRWAPALAIAASVILELIARLRLWLWCRGRSLEVCECVPAGTGNRLMQRLCRKCPLPCSNQRGVRSEALRSTGIPQMLGFDGMSQSGESEKYRP